VSAVFDPSPISLPAFLRFSLADFPLSYAIDAINGSESYPKND